MTERKTVSTAPYTIGAAPFRPGDESNFGDKFKEKPDDLNRPDPINCQANDTIQHAAGLVRVLDDDHKAKGEWNPELSAEDMIQ